MVLGVCDVEGAPQPTGFVLSSCIKGLQATYELLTPEQYEQYERLQEERRAGRVRRRRDDVDHFVGMSEWRGGFGRERGVRRGKEGFRGRSSKTTIGVEVVAQVKCPAPPLLSCKLLPHSS